MFLLLRLRSFIKPSRAASYTLLRLLWPVLSAGVGVWLLLGALAPADASPGPAIWPGRPASRVVPRLEASVSANTKFPTALSASHFITFEIAWSSAESLRAYSAAWGDVDNDGDLDLMLAGGTDYDPVCACYPGRLRMYQNNAGTLTTNAAWINNGNDTANSIAWGDYDGDGDLDLVVGNGYPRSPVSYSYYPAPVQLYKNVQGVLSATPVWTATEMTDAWSIAWGDVDNDNDLDLAVGGYGQPNRIYRNLGGALTASPVWTSTQVYSTTSVAWGDMNGDGYLDLAIGNQGQANGVYQNNSGALTATPVWTATEIAQTFSLAWGDYDADGDVDLAVGNFGYPAPDPNYVYRNDSGMLTTSAVWTSPENDMTASVAWGDFDRDGGLDLAVGNYNLGEGAGTRVYRYTGGAFALNWSSAESDDIYAVAWGDMNNDGLLDLAAGASGLSRARIYRNFLTPLAKTGAQIADFAVGYDNSTALAWGDINGDGDLDLALSAENKPTVVLNNVSGVLSATPVFTSANAGDTRALAWGDVDNDGDLDLAAADFNGRIKIYHNTGSALQAAAAWNSSADERNVALAWNDFDNDGDLDLAVGREQDPTVLYRNNGGTLSASPVWASYESEYTRGLAWGDVDNDGDADLVTVGEPYNYLYRNNAGALTARAVWTAAVGVFINHADWGDVDGDGDLDLALSGRPNVLFRNENGRLSAAPVWSSDENSYAHSATWGDFDHDGDLDLAVGGAVEDSAAIYRNENGALTNSAAWLSQESDHAKLAAWGDVDNDGDLDLAGFSVYGKVYVYTNTRAIGIPAVNPLRPGRNADFNSLPQVQVGNIAIGYTLRDANYLPAQRVQAYYSLNSGGQWYPAVAASGTLSTNLSTSPTGKAYTYTWDVNSSGFFGQTDDMAFRLEAFPSLSPSGANYTNTAPMPFQYGKYLAQTFPFRVRGTQLRVMSNTTPIANALVYRLPANQSLGAQTIADSAGVAFRTDGQGYLQGRGQINLGDRLVAFLPITSTSAYTLYHTSAAPTLTGLDAFTVTAPGVQTLHISPNNRLILFDLKVSLEWDARNDPLFLTQLQADLRRASELLFDWANGQAALGRVTISQAKEHWTDAHVRVYATNSFRPNAVIGGIVSEPISETNVVNGLTNTLDYAPGQVSMPAVWNRFGDAGGSVGEDWPRTLAHELAHYLFFLDDAYLGLDASGRLIALDTCTGTAMADPYRADYSEFKHASDWSPGCDNTLAARTSGRPEWTTLSRFYPLLAPVNPGPNSLPLDVTQVEIVNPGTPTTTLNAPIFHLTQNGGRVTPGPDARAILFQGERLVDLGRATQDEIVARGASPGDRLCLYEIAAERLGCETVTAGDTELALGERPGWQPEVILTPVTSRTISLSVANVPAGAILQARLYPVDGSASTIITLTQGSTSLPTTLDENLIGAALTNTVYLPLISRSGPVTFVSYSGTFQFTQPALAGSVVVWVSEGEPRREVIADYSLGGNPAPPRRSRRKGGAPTTSPDGQVTLYGDLDFALGEFYALQSVTRLPNLPEWVTVIGKGYRLLKSAGAPDFTGSSLNFSYFASDVPAGEENFLRVYYYDGAAWQALPTQVDRAHGNAIAATQGAGLYALLSSFPIPLYGPGWNQFTYPVQGTKLVTEALVSVSGYYTTVYGTVLTDTQDPWKVYDVTAPDWVNDLSQLEFAKSYWINVSQAITLQVTGGGPQTALGTAALPSPPATFYGAVQSGPGFTPAPEMVVTAWIGGKACGQGKTLLVSGQVMYTINVLPEGTGGAAGCGAPGRMITFKVGAQAMTTAAAWDIDQVHDLALAP